MSQKVPVMALVLSGFLISKVAGQETLGTTVPMGATSLEIQRALDCLPDSGGEVVLGPGVYTISEPIVLRRSGQTLRGSGSATCLRLGDQAQCPVIIMGEPVNFPGTLVSHLRVADLSIDGNRRQQREETWQGSAEGSNIRNNGITVQGVTDSSIEHVSASGCRSGGLVTTRYVRRLVVRDYCATDNEFDGLACYCTEASVFIGLHLYDNRAAGISFDLSASHNVIADAMLQSNDLGIFMRDSRNNLYSNVVISDCRKFGVFLAQSEGPTPSGWQPLAHTECSGNNFESLKISRCRAAFRVNDLTCGGNSITNSEFRDNPQGGLSLAAPNLVTTMALLER